MGYKLTWMYIGQDKIRPTWWSPNSNTVAYRPLTNDLNDIVGGHNLTSNWSDYSFTTDSQWKNCLALNLGSTSSTTYLENNSVHSQIDMTKSYTFAFKIWEWIVRTSSWASTKVFSFGYQIGVGTYAQYTEAGSPAENGALLTPWEWIGDGGDTWLVTVANAPHVNDATMHSCIITRNVGVWFEAYVDWTLIVSWTRGWTYNTPSTFILGRDMYDNWQWRYVAAKLSHCVIEEWVWDNDRMSAYNNM